jgi:hypothetical protein
LKSPLSVIVIVSTSFLLASACGTTRHDFLSGSGGGGSGSGSNGSGGSGASSAGTESVSGGSAGSKAQPTTGGSTQEGGAPTNEGGAGGEGNPAGECVQSQHESCWELENGTPIPGARPAPVLGSCHVGERYCTPDLTWGPCLGAVAPKAKDDCNVAGNDDDCDGTPNSGCQCVTGTKRACGSDIGSCVKGEQTCVAQVWGKCEGEVMPQALDSCAEAGNDDNCNGKANEGCPCVGTESEACGECGTRHCNAAARQWGACLPAPSECTGPTQVRDCSAQGTWSTSTCQFACVEGQCTGACVPGSKRCIANPERRQECSNQGIFTTTETCAGNKLCTGGGTSCVAPCAGQKLCPGNVCAPLGGCCSNAECANGFACVDGTCSTTTCQPGLKGPCGGVCTSGCCSVNDCAEKPNMARGCSGSHLCTYSCKTNFGNCDDNESNGCEVNLIAGTPSGVAVKHCGQCGTTCEFVNPSGNTDCHTFANACNYAECRASFVPIGETNEQFAYHCAQRRPHATLYRGDCGGYCGYDCDIGYQDCNYDRNDGCETPSANADEYCSPTPYWGGEY